MALHAHELSDGQGVFLVKQSGVGMIELLVSLLLFAVCVVGLSHMQMKTGMESLDNHQRSVALWGGRGLIDRISINNSAAALAAYKAQLTALESCPEVTPRLCEATDSDAESIECSVQQMVTSDIWTTFCSADSGLDSQLVDYEVELNCAGASCASDSNMTLTISWVSKYTDSDKRMQDATVEREGEDVAASLDFITLEFRP